MGAVSVKFVGISQYGHKYNADFSEGLQEATGEEGYQGSSVFGTVKGTLDNFVKILKDRFSIHVSEGAYWEYHADVDEFSILADHKVVDPPLKHGELIEAIRSIPQLRGFGLGSKLTIDFRDYITTGDLRVSEEYRLSPGKVKQYEVKGYRETRFDSGF